jgi:hypothetical protein
MILFVSGRVLAVDIKQISDLTRVVNEKRVVCSLDLLLDIFPKVLSDSGLQ